MQSLTKATIAEKRAKVVPRYGAAPQNSSQSTHQPPVAFLQSTTTSTKKEILGFERNLIF